MKISEYILKEFNALLNAHSVLVVYDSDGRYESVFNKLSSEKCRAIKATESTIQSRLDAEASLLDLAKANPVTTQLAIYVQRPMPIHEEDQQAEPFSYFASIGQAFPIGDGHSYHSLCRKAKPSHVVEIDKLFADGKEPSFETVDAVDAGGGMSWPRLRSLLKADSAQDIVFKFLSANEALRKTFDESDDWVDEINDFLERTFELKLVTRGKKWRSISDEMWRFCLFSEFAFDLPSGLPDNLKNVPHAQAATSSLIFELCDRLRDNRNTKLIYMEQAEQIARDLDLAATVTEIPDFGNRDTFAFEERGFLRQYVQAVAVENFDQARAIELTHRNSIWVSETDAVQEWRLVAQACQLLQAVEDFKRDQGAPASTTMSLVDCYTTRLRVIDQHHRVLLQAEEDLMQQTQDIADLVDATSAKYETLVGDFVRAFTSAVSRDGWPLESLPRNRDVFTKFVEPALKAGEKIAYFLIDSLRYELALELQHELEQIHTVDLSTVSAQLPTVTPVGMASLMPQADKKFSLIDQGDTIVPALDNHPVKNTVDRANWIRSIYGDRYMDVLLQDVVKQSGNLQISNSVDLLVVRNTEIDLAGETDASFALREIPRALQKIRVAVKVLGDLGFNHVVIATDHGFHLRTSVRPGYKTIEPDGDWIFKKDRCLIGEGTVTDQVVGFKVEEVGIPYKQGLYVVPKSLGTFVEGRSYFHAGLSLQECVLPVLTIRSGQTSDDSENVIVNLSYKDGKTDKITTQRPILEVSYQSSDIFGKESIQIRLEARAKGDVLVGEPTIGKNVDPATGLVTISSSQTIKVPLRMDEEYEGSFEVIALDPDTMRSYDTIKLKTDYLR